jgi:hypothetical protein
LDGSSCRRAVGSIGKIRDRELRLTTPKSSRKIGGKSRDLTHLQHQAG